VCDQHTVMSTPWIRPATDDTECTYLDAAGSSALGPPNCIPSVRSLPFVNLVEGCVGTCPCLNGTLVIPSSKTQKTIKKGTVRAMEPH
jgi:hypothetical protein